MRVGIMLVLALLLGAAVHAQAVPSDVAPVVTPSQRAADLFREGRAHMVAQRWAEACVSFAASQQAEAASGTLLNLGDCQERQYLRALAYRSFLAAETLARARRHGAHEAEARRRALALLPRLHRLRMRFAARADDDPRVVVRINGEVAGVLPGGGYALELGRNRVHIEVPNRPPWTTELELALDLEGGGETRLELPAPGRLGRAALSPQQLAAPAGARDSDGASRGLTTRRKLALGALVLGLGATAVGSYYGVRALRRWDDAEAGCDALGCSTESVRLGRLADDDATVSTVTLVGAGVVLFGAGVLWWTGGPGAPRPQRRQARVAPLLLGDSFGLQLTGDL
ncbi:MAG: hypothetical protein IT370_08110 [Deltaproteobacteria bacterium]|nr:hypothetical protein [Deltaproteobacteria bacterium]